MLDKISWTQDLLNEMKKKIEHNWAYIALCKNAVRTKDNVIRELIGSSFASSTPGDRKEECCEAWKQLTFEFNTFSFAKNEIFL